MVRITPIKDEYKDTFESFVNEQAKNDNALLTHFSATDSMDNERSEILVCFDEEENILGICKTSFTDLIGVLAIDYVYVKPDCRRDENGTLLVVAIMQRAVNRLIARLICNTEISEINFAFLKKLGFTLTLQNEDRAFFTKNLLYMYKTEKHE